MRLLRDLVGVTLGDRYRLGRRLAGGGTGEVYEATDLLLERTVAVKVLQPSFAADPEAVGRFRARARVAARLDHPHLVAVYDWGAQDHETYYVVMEYVEGTDLRDLLVARGALEPAHAAEIMMEVCSGLGAAHAGGLVHRDVKPENILVGRDGRVRLGDVGTALLEDTSQDLPGSGIMGTLRYLAPERIQGADASWASDIWAAGAVLSELLTGRPPLQGAGDELLTRRVREPVEAPSRMDPRVPPVLDRIVQRACSLDPADRYLDARAMAEDLRAAVLSMRKAPSLEILMDDVTGEIDLPEGASIASRRRPGRRRRRRGVFRRVARLVVIVAILALLVAGGLKAAPIFFGPADVEVPDLGGLERRDAIARAEELGLEAEVTERHFSIEVDKGLVLDQEPDSGVLKEGSTIRLTVSDGLPPVDVPDVTGLSLKRAEHWIDAVGLEVGDVTESYSSKPAGRVIGARPHNGELPWGQPVDLVVSKGPAPVTVPDVAGVSPEDAAQRLEEAGLEPALFEAFSDDVPEGEIVSIDPAGGEVVPKGSRVEIVISLGPEFEEVTVPDVRGQRGDSAGETLRALGLRVAEAVSCDRGKKVVETDPVAGTVVRENDLVTIFLC